jgi:hypothetical protein
MTALDSGAWEISSESRSFENIPRCGQSVAVAVGRSHGFPNYFSRQPPENKSPAHFPCQKPPGSRCTM